MTTVVGTVAVVVVAARRAGAVAVGEATPKRTPPAMAIEPATASEKAMACGVEFMVEQNETGK